MPDSARKLNNDAFISYNGADAGFARLLERSLEHYRPPKGLTVRNGVLRVFRYEGDMVGTDYDAAIRKQLSESRHLILICSPQARQSPYVSEEVKLFAEQRGAENIIPILLRGQANNETESEEKKAFPESLTDLVRMPLAISFLDFDPSRDKITTGKHQSSWFSLLANMYEVSRDDMEQREQGRRRRRQRQWMAGLSMVTVIVSVLAVFAWLQRGQALQAQAEAEAQVLTLQAERQSLAGHVESALLLASAALQRTLGFDDVSPNAGARTIIFRHLPEFEGLGLPGWHAAWPRQRLTEPWAVGDSSGRWLMTGNFSGNTAFLWDLSEDGFTESPRVLQDVPDNYADPSWESAIAAYLESLLPEVTGHWLIPLAYDESDGESDLERHPRWGEPIQRLSNSRWILYQEAGENYWLVKGGEHDSMVVPIVLRQEPDDGWGFGSNRIFVTNDDRWLVHLGHRSHRLIDLRQAASQAHYAAPVSAVEWVADGNVLYTLHDDGSSYRWSADGSSDATGIQSTREDGSRRDDGGRNLLMSNDEQWLLLQHGAGDWSVWRSPNGNWVRQEFADMAERRSFADTVNRGITFRTNRIGPVKEMPVAFLEHGLAASIESDGVLSLLLPEGTAKLQLDDLGAEYTLDRKSAVETSVDNQKSPGADSDYTVSPDGQWRASGWGLERRRPPENTESSTLGNENEPASRWSAPVLWPDVGAVGNPAYFFFSQDSRWLLIGVGYNGFRSCDYLNYYYRIDLAHPTPIDSFMPLRTGHDWERCPRIEFSATSKLLMASHALWFIDSGEVDPAVLPGAGVSINDDEDLIAVEVSMQNDATRIMLFPLDAEELARHVCRVVGRNLIAEEWRELFGDQSYYPLCAENPVPPDYRSDD